MPALLFRVAHRRYLPQDPGGALSNPGRWHGLGQSVLYFSSSLALAVLEMRANGVSFETLRASFHYTQTQVDGIEGVEAVPEVFFGKDWAASKESSRELGSRWFAEKRSLILEVKSAVIPVERNFLINAAHPAFARLAFSDASAIPLDPRL